MQVADTRLLVLVVDSYPKQNYSQRRAADMRVVGKQEQLVADTQVVGMLLQLAADMQAVDKPLPQVADRLVADKLSQLAVDTLERQVVDKPPQAADHTRVVAADTQAVAGHKPVAAVDKLAVAVRKQAVGHKPAAAVDKLAVAVRKQAVDHKPAAAVDTQAAEAVVRQCKRRQAQWLHRVLCQQFPSFHRHQLKSQLGRVFRHFQRRSQIAVLFVLQINYLSELLRPEFDFQQLHQKPLLSHLFELARESLRASFAPMQASPR